MMMPTKRTVTQPEGEDERNSCCTFPTFDYIIGPIKVSSLSLFTYKKGPRHRCPTRDIGKSRGPGEPRYLALHYVDCAKKDGKAFTGDRVHLPQRALQEIHRAYN